MSWKGRRLLLRGLIATIVIALAYAASPYIAVARFALDVKAGRAERVVDWIDAPRLRQSLASQVVRAYAARSGQPRSMGPLDRRIAGMVAAGYVDTLLAEQFPPDRIVAMLLGKQGAIGDAAALPLSGAGFSDWQMPRSAGFIRLNRFALNLPQSESGPSRLVFGLSGAGWRLRSVALPDAVLHRFVDRLKPQLEL